MTRKMKAKFQNTVYGLTQIEKRKRENGNKFQGSHGQRIYIFFSLFIPLFQFVMLLSDLSYQPLVKICTPQNNTL